METRLTLKPGQNGTKKLAALYRDRLVCVRYLYDRAQGKRYKTVELIVEERSWTPRPRVGARVKARNAHDLVGVRIAFNETELRRRAKDAGAIWRPRHRLWEMRWKSVRELGLENRVAKT